MQQNNIQPFVVEQWVMAIKSGKHFAKGSIFIVQGMIKCKCGMVGIDIGIATTFGNSICPDCNSIVSGKSSKQYHDHRFFSLITENFQSITLAKILGTETPLVGVN